MRRMIICIGLVTILFMQSASAQEIWVGKDGNIRNVDARAMVIENGRMILATKNELYQASDPKDKWRPIFSVPSGANEISCLGGSSRNIVVGTRRGLFRSIDGGRTWRNIFRTIIPGKNNILAIELSKYDPKRLWIGTEKGVFASEDGGDRWRDISANLKNKCVVRIAANKDLIYISTGGGVYLKKGEAAGWERLYVRSPAEGLNEEESPASSEAESEEGPDDAANCIALKNLMLYVGTDKKILYSDDAGKSWRTFPRDGLGGTVRDILPSQKSEKIYCVTSKGIFEFLKDREQWFELYKGMDKALGVSRIIFDGEDENSLWALSTNGLYKLESGRYAIDQYIDVERNLKSMKVMFATEPEFKELQQAATNFAEVDPDKIKSWRAQARLKALIPKVSFGLDNNRSSNSEIYTSATRDYIVMGPDDVNKGIDVSVSWELGDLIWSSDQTAIDVRSRLTTQLRNDILDDLRRVYYERRRLQYEIMMAPPRDLKLRFEKEMRLQELTQAIDDLTGNYLSEHMRPLTGK